MKYARNNVKADAKERTSAQQITVDFGNRRICTQNFSKLVALPKPALANCGDGIKQVNVKLVQTSSEKYLKLTPVA